MSNEATVDYSEIKGALGSIGLSAVLILAATFVSQGLGLLTRITMARYLPVNGYGNVALGISILSLLGIVALSGLPPALSRYLPRKETGEEQRRVVAAAFHIVGIFSVVLSMGTFLLAEPVSRVVFGNLDIVWVIRIFALTLPCYALFKLSIGGFRGYERTKPQILTDKVLLPGLQLVGIIAFVTLGYDTAGIAFAYAVAFALVAVVSVGIIYRLGGFSAQDIFNGGSLNQYRELLEFSVPLAASGAINTVAKHSDLVILGIFLSSGVVGVYEVSFRMSMFVVFFFSPAIGYLFQPLISKLESESEFQKMDQLYTVTTRWVVVATFPVFALLALFPDQTLTFIFGNEYAAGALALTILSIGFMASRIPGLTGSFLTATGNSKVIMYISVATAVLNIAANFILIPIYGILGAAIATASARIFNNAIESYIIYREFGIHPFNRNYTRPTIIMLCVLCGFTVAPISTRAFSFSEGFVIASLLGVTYFICLLITRSLYSVELSLVDALFSRIGVPFSVSKYLHPFVR